MHVDEMKFDTFLHFECSISLAVCLSLGTFFFLLASIQLLVSLKAVSVKMRWEAVPKNVSYITSRNPLWL